MSCAHGVHNSLVGDRAEHISLEKRLYLDRNKYII